MRIRIVHNPGSGRGVAARAAERVRAVLARAGHTPDRRAAGDAEGEPADLLVLIGGDGTVKHALDEAIARDTPVYHIPVGNENLFAREFGMLRDPEALARAIERWDVCRIDVGVAESGAGRERFAIMLSVGPDASVIHRMQRGGREIPGHLAYLGPIAEEVGQPALVPVWATVDGRTLARGEQGMLIAANIRRYAFGLDPAREADPRDGLLDVVFIPAAGVWPLLWAGLAGLAGNLRAVRGVVMDRGARVEVCAPGGPVQADGEAVEAGESIVISVQRRALRILLPEGRR